MKHAVGFFGLFPSLLLAACVEGSRDPEGRAAGASAGVVEGTATAAESLAAAAAATFDPGTLQTGDTVLGLTVASVEVGRVLDDSMWVGSVVFEGDLVLHGIYQPHPDWPVVTLPCLHVVQPASITRVPHFPADPFTGPDSRTWFCFDDADAALELLGSPERPREVVIAVGRYRAQRQVSDAYDTAELAEVIEVGPAAGPTLRDP